jgi:hypothetical protein
MARLEVSRSSRRYRKTDTLVADQSRRSRSTLSILKFGNRCVAKPLNSGAQRTRTVLRTISAVIAQAR